MGGITRAAEFDQTWGSMGTKNVTDSSRQKNGA